MIEDSSVFTGRMVVFDPGETVLRTNLHLSDTAVIYDRQKREVITVLKNGLGVPMTWIHSAVPILVDNAERYAVFVKRRRKKKNVRRTRK